MIEVTATRKVEQPSVRTVKKSVKVHGFDRLTPKAARAALEIAFGDDKSGEVWHGDLGYQVFPNTTKKVRRKAS